MLENELHQSAYIALKARNYDLAWKEYTELAAVGSPTAWTSLGWMYEHAAGVARNAYEAEQCYSKAVALGHLPAKFYLARFLVTEREYRRAFALFSSAADFEHVPSMYWLGRLFLTGRGTEKDVSKAEYFLKKAMDSGHIYARRDYHGCRLSGEFGRRQFSDIAGWISAVIAGAKMAVSDSNSELLQ